MIDRPKVPTPRTDAEIILFVLPDNPLAEYVPAALARTLERELAAEFAAAHREREEAREVLRAVADCPNITGLGPRGIARAYLAKHTQEVGDPVVKQIANKLYEDET